MGGGNADDMIIDFYTWCPKCENAKLKDTDDPCNDCLSIGGRTDGSTKPVCFKEKKNEKVERSDGRRKKDD